MSYPHLDLFVCSDRPDAQEICECRLDEAFSVCPESLAVLTQKCAYSRIIMDLDEAKNEAQQAIELFNNQKTKDDDTIDYEVTLTLARLCSDIGMSEEAVTLLEYLLLRNESDVRI